MVGRGDEAAGTASGEIDAMDHHSKPHFADHWRGAVIDQVGRRVIELFEFRRLERQPLGVVKNVEL